MTELIPKHGGYRKLKSFQVAQLVYDVTVLFVARFVDPYSRTKDQMVQAARSGVQNIAEGSAASATSKKMEIKLTQVARASLEELVLDYEDFLRHRNLPMFDPDHPILQRFKQLRCRTLRELRRWVAVECKRPDAPEPACLAANAALSLLNLATYLLERQVDRLAEDFKKEGGFTERLYAVRSNARRTSRG